MEPFTSLQLHEIAEAGHRVLNPFTEAKLLAVGAATHLRGGEQILDLASGTGEMLCRFAAEFGTGGHGVDLSPVFVDRARSRALELGVADRVTFTEADAGAFRAEPRSYDVVSCLGATWIGGGPAGTVRLMLPALRPGGVVLIGEPYWIDPLPGGVDPGFPVEEFTDLVGTAELLRAAGLELVEMVLADADSWDRYAAEQWWTLDDWLRRHPDHPHRGQVESFLANARQKHLAWQRRYLGWGAFVCRPAR